jgi:uncharacterized protein
MVARETSHTEGGAERRAPVSEERARAFLVESERVAVVGSVDPTAFPATVRTALAEHGIEVVPVSARTGTAEGDDGVFVDLASVPGRLDGVVVMVSRDHAEDVVREAIERGVPRVWLFRGAGPGAVSDAAVARCEEAGIEVVAGACPLMFLDPVAWIHRAHRAARRWRHHLVPA